MATWIERLYSDFLARDLSYIAAGALVVWTWAILLRQPDFLRADGASGIVGRIVLFYFLGSILRDVVVGATSLIPKHTRGTAQWQPNDQTVNQARTWHRRFHWLVQRLFGAPSEGRTWKWTYLHLSKEVDEDDLPEGYQGRYLNMFHDVSKCYSPAVMKHLERIIFGVTSTSALAAGGILGLLSVLFILPSTQFTEQLDSDPHAQALALMVNLAFVFILWPANRELTQRLAKRYRSLAEEIPSRMVSGGLEHGLSRGPHLRNRGSSDPAPMRVDHHQSG